MRKIVAFIIFLSFLLFSLPAFGLNTYYNNKTGYNNLGGYNNKIPYSAFFSGEHSPQQEQKMIQVVTRSGETIQGVVNTNTPEEKIEQQGINK